VTDRLLFAGFAFASLVVAWSVWELLKLLRGAW
jgi:hypothetical protein